MNDEYLWDKTGGNKEIERLEEVLAVFRYRETDKPTSVAIKSGDERAPRWRISLAFAFASCVVVTLLVLSWLPLAEDGPVAKSDVVFVQPSEMPEPVPVIQNLPPTQNSGSQHRAPDTRKRTISRTIAASHRRLRSKDSSPRDNVAALTAEERFAYQQLMLALSITGSKLKIVQDTIDGTEDSNDDSKNQR
jgi:hypothetical protein